MIDEVNIYAYVERCCADHQTGNHKTNEYVRDDTYTHSVKGYFSVPKQSIYGIYQHVSEVDLHRYVAKFSLHYSF